MFKQLQTGVLGITSTVNRVWSLPIWEAPVWHSDHSSQTPSLPHLLPSQATNPHPAPGQTIPATTPPLQTQAELHAQPWESLQVWVLCPPEGPSSRNSRNLWLGCRHHVCPVTQASLQPEQGHQTELENGRKTNEFTGVNVVRLRELQAWACIWTELSTRTALSWEEELGELLAGFLLGNEGKPILEGLWSYPDLQNHPLQVTQPALGEGFRTCPRKIQTITLQLKEVDISPSTLHR